MGCVSTGAELLQLTGVELQQLNGHSEWVRSVAFSYDDTSIISGSDVKSVQVWGVSTHAETLQLNGHTHVVCCSDIPSIQAGNRKHHSFLWTSTMDGWIVSPGQDHLVWIPQGIREVIHHPYNTLIISQKGYAHIDFQGCNVGTKWAECYKPLLV